MTFVPPFGRLDSQYVPNQPVDPASIYAKVVQLLASPKPESGEAMRCIMALGEILLTGSGEERQKALDLLLRAAISPDAMLRKMAGAKIHQLYSGMGPKERNQIGKAVADFVLPRNTGDDVQRPTVKELEQRTSSQFVSVLLMHCPNDWIERPIVSPPPPTVDTHPMHGEEEMAPGPEGTNTGLDFFETEGMDTEPDREGGFDTAFMIEGLMDTDTGFGIEGDPDPELPIEGWETTGLEILEEDPLPQEVKDEVPVQHQQEDVEDIDQKAPEDGKVDRNAERLADYEQQWQEYFRRMWDYDPNDLVFITDSSVNQQKKMPIIVESAKDIPRLLKSKWSLRRDKVVPFSDVRFLNVDRKTASTLVAEGNNFYRHNIISDPEEEKLRLRFNSTPEHREFTRIPDQHSLKDRIGRHIDCKDLYEGKIVCQRFYDQQNDKYLLLLVQDGLPILFTDNKRDRNFNYVEAMGSGDEWGIFANNEKSQNGFDLWVRKSGPFASLSDEEHGEFLEGYFRSLAGRDEEGKNLHPMDFYRGFNALIEEILAPPPEEEETDESKEQDEEPDDKSVDRDVRSVVPDDRSVRSENSEREENQRRERRSPFPREVRAR